MGKTYKENLIYIIILNWNGLKDTVECVESVLRNDFKYYHILIIDNGSKKNEYTSLKKVFGSNKRITLIHSKKNLGFAGGVNLGIKKSMENNATYSLLLNNDTKVASNFLSELINVAEKDKNAGILSSNIFYYDNPNRLWAGGVYFNYYFPPLSRTFQGKKPAEVSDVVGCCMLIRNEVFRAAGLFNEKFFAYGEETDLNFRVKKYTNYKIIVVPKSKVYHKVSKSTGGGFNKTVAYFKMRNKVLHAKLNYGLKYWPTYLIFLILYFVKEQIKAFTRGNIPVSVSLLKGFRDGILA